MQSTSLRSKFNCFLTKFGANKKHRRSDRKSGNIVDLYSENVLLAKKHNIRYSICYGKQTLFFEEIEFDVPGTIDIKKLCGESDLITLLYLFYFLFLYYNHTMFIDVQ